MARLRLVLVVVVGHQLDSAQLLDVVALEFLDIVEAIQQAVGYRLDAAQNLAVVDGKHSDDIVVVAEEEGNCLDIVEAGNCLEIVEAEGNLIVEQCLAVELELLAEAIQQAVALERFVEVTKRMCVFKWSMS
jgi:hypothetical protein